MKSNRHLRLAILSAFLMVFSNAMTGCTTTTPDKATGKATDKATGQAAGQAAGEAQFKKTCSECHTASSKSKLSLAGIKASGMTMKLNDAQLQAIVDYLATQ